MLLTASVSEMETQMSAFAEDTDRAKQFLELAKKYTDFSELTTPMINEFVEKIIVHAPEKIDGFWRKFRESVKSVDPDAILIGEVWFCSGQSNMEMPQAAPHQKQGAVSENQGW